MKVQYLNPPKPDQIDLAQPIDWQHPQARGLAHHWLASASSGVLRDVKGRRNAIPVGGATIRAVGGWPALATGSGAYAYVASPWTNYATELMTISCWFYETSQAATLGVLSIANTATSGGPTWLIQANSGTLRYYDGGYSTVGTIPANKWHHVAIAWVGGTVMKVYFNGVFVDNQTSPQAQSYLYFGSGYNGQLRGGLADVRYYNRPLDASEIYNLWHPGRRWGMLRTLTGRRVFTVPAAGPAFKPYWIRRPSQLIAGGLN